MSSIKRIVGITGLLAAAIFIATACAYAGEASWEREWDKTVKAAEQEGQLSIYALSEIGEVLVHGGFTANFLASN